MEQTDEISQHELKSILLPVFKRNGGAFKKCKSVMALVSEGGEVIETITDDGHETTNRTCAGDYVVKNTTEKGESYVVKPTAFKKRYTFEEKASDGYSRYKPIGTVFAVALDDEILAMFGRKHELIFIAPWDEKVVAKTGDLLVSPMDYSEIYRIAKKEFDETYKKLT